MAWTFETLVDQKPKVLEEILREGKAPDLDGMIGWEFRGWNVVPPAGQAAVALLGIRRFAKGFYQRPGQPKPSEGGEVFGYNVDIRRGGKTDPWTGKPSDEAPRRRGFFRVFPPGQGERIADHPNALFLEYEQERNGVFDGGGLFGKGGLRDFVAQVDARNPDLFVGKAYYVLGPVKTVGGYFVLERWRQCEFREE